jgi:uncharacterized protein YndB with AHSA1/START domain
MTGREAEVPVPGEPEDVWRAIATPDGTAAWQFRTEVEGREGGTVVIRRRPFGDDAEAVVTAWEPPRRLAYEEPASPGTPALATEYLVTARGDGTCVVRVVSSLAGDDIGGGTDAGGWEDLLEGATQGWRMALTILRSYLTHFAGQPVAALDTIATVDRPLGDSAAVFAAVMCPLGVEPAQGPAVGDRFRSRAGAPPLAGVVDRLDETYALLRTTEPCPALFAVSAFPMDGVTLSVNVCGRFYGPDGPATAAREQWRWDTWLRRQLGTKET